MYLRNMIQEINQELQHNRNIYKELSELIDLKF